MSAQMLIPAIKDIPGAIQLYYEKIALSTTDIKNLFGVAQAKATALKKIVQEKMIEEEQIFYSAKLVDTETAFRVWGLDIANLEKRYSKLKKYEMLS